MVLVSKGKGKLWIDTYLKFVEPCYIKGRTYFYRVSLKNPNVVTRYFTFGQGHLHPKTCEPMKDNVIEIIGRTWADCREAMIERYGLKWSSDYEHMPENHPDGYYIFRKYETIIAGKESEILYEEQYEN